MAKKNLNFLSFQNIFQSRNGNFGITIVCSTNRSSVELRVENGLDPIVVRIKDCFLSLQIIVDLPIGQFESGKEHFYFRISSIHKICEKNNEKTHNIVSNNCFY